jgi:hypothetical protein
MCFLPNENLSGENPFQRSLFQPTREYWRACGETIQFQQGTAPEKMQA